MHRETGNQNLLRLNSCAKISPSDRMKHAVFSVISVIATLLASQPFNIAPAYSYPHTLLKQSIEMQQKTRVDIDIKPAPVYVAPPSANINIEQPDNSSWVTAATLDMSDSYDCVMNNEGCYVLVKVDVQSLQRRGDIVDFRITSYCLDGKMRIKSFCKSELRTSRPLPFRAKCSNRQMWANQKWTTMRDDFSKVIDFACDS